MIIILIVKGFKKFFLGVLGFVKKSYNERFFQTHVSLNTEKLNEANNQFYSNCLSHKAKSNPPEKGGL